jgi:hypothetical protein
MVRVKSIFVCGALVLLLVSASSVFGAPGDGRSYVSGNYFLTLDGVKCGYVKSVDGGAISAEVINEPAGPSYFTKKHIGQPKYEDVAFQFGFSMTPDIYNWISDAWSMNFTRKNCLLTSLDYSLNAKDAVQFDHCLITETTIPACDGSSKEPAYLSLKLAPEYTHPAPATSISGDYGKNQQKVWLPSNFVLAIDGLDCSKVNKIDSFTVKQNAVTDDIGDARDMLKEPGKLEFPNLRITFAEATLQTWKAWFDSFVVQGNNDESQEKSGTLTFLSPNRQDQLLTIKFHNLGIFKLEKEGSEANSDQISRWVADLYCERMELPKVGPGGARTKTESEEPAKTDSSTSSNVRRGSDSPLVTKSLTTNTALDPSLTTSRKFGSSPAFDFALKGIDYTVTRQRVSNDAYAPDAKSKLMLIRYTIHNPSAESMNVGPSLLEFQVTDSAGANHKADDIGVGANLQRIGGSITPDQTIDCCAIVTVPGNVDADALTITCSEDNSIQKYQVGGKAQIKELFARDGSAGAAARYTALSEVPASTGTFYPMMNLDYRLDGMAYAARPKSESDMPENARCLVATFTIRNPSPESVHCDSATFSPVLTMSDGSNMEWRGYPLSGEQDKSISGSLTPGQEARMRVFFDVPSSGEVTPASFRFAERDSRIYIYSVKDLKPARRIAA